MGCGECGQPLNSEDGLIAARAEITQLKQSLALAENDAKVTGEIASQRLEKMKELKGRVAELEAERSVCPAIMDPRTDCAPLGKAERALANAQPILDAIQMPQFRGLWKSRTVHPDGRIELGWSVTYVSEGDYCEVPYQTTATEAARLALDAKK